MRIGAAGLRVRNLALVTDYYRDALGLTYLFSLNRVRADADVVLTSTGTRSLACFGRVMLPHRLEVPQL